MYSTGDSQNLVDPASARELSLSTIYKELCSFVDALLSNFPGSESVSVYFAKRSRHKPSIRQDLMPLLVYKAVGGQVDISTMPLAASWALNLAASHFLDDAQDNGRFQNVNDGVMALGAANVALAQLDTDEDTLRDILDAIGRVAALGANAQNDELRNGRIWSQADYFRNVAGKAAAIIATGVWMGGRLATNETETLNLLKEFGLALGMANQISDDCLDLIEDLTQGTYTLPVIKGLAMTEHADHPTLKQLIDQSSLGERDVKAIVDILTSMGAIDDCKRIVRAYQVQAAALFKILPGLEAYFANYVVPKS
jgi:Polyprenyl synthetase